jgi:DNA repair protein RadC
MPSPPRKNRAANGHAAPLVTLYTPAGDITSSYLAEEPPGQQPARPTLKDLPAADRPREKLKHLGAATLSDAELLAILLRVGTAGETVVELAQRLLREYHGLTGLARVPFSELEGLHGLGEAKVAQLKAALELGRRLLLAEPGERITVDRPDKIGPLLVLEMRPLEQEVFKTILLNTKHQVIKIVDVHRGSINSSLVRAGDVFREPVRQGAAAVIVAHNHPSGDTTPSRQDIEVTEQLVAAGKLLDIDVLDHLIIGHTWASMRAQGAGFKS